MKVTIDEAGRAPKKHDHVEWALGPYGGYQAIEGEVTVGVLVAFIAALNNFFDPIQSLSQFYTTYQAGMAALDKIFELLDEEPDLKDKPDAIELPRVRGEIRFEDVCFTYGGEGLALCHLDLDIPPRYFESLMERTEKDPRIGTCSGKPYMELGGRLVSEKCGDDTSVGMTKLYRTECYAAIGGFGMRPTHSSPISRGSSIARSPCAHIESAPPAMVESLRGHMSALNAVVSESTRRHDDLDRTRTRSVGPRRGVEESRNARRTQESHRGAAFLWWTERRRNRGSDAAVFHHGDPRVE